MFKISGRQRAVFLGTAGLSVLAAMVASSAEAQTRPATSRPGSTSGSQRDGGASNSEGTRSGSPSQAPARRSAPAPKPRTDIIDLRDRHDGEDGSLVAAGGKVIPGVVTCEAGCDGPPGKVVFAAVTTAPAMLDPIQRVSLNAAPDVNPAPQATTADLACVAGCFNEPAWKPYGAKPAVVVASLTTAPMPVAVAAPVPLPARHVAAKAKPVSTAVKTPAAPVRTAALVAAPAEKPDVRVVTPAKRAHVKRHAAKRHAIKSKHRAIVRKSRPSIIVNPAVKYPPRPLPVAVRMVEAKSSPVRKPKQPIGPFTTKVTYAKPQEQQADAMTVVAIARRATRDPAFRHSLVTVSSDWLNRAKRDAAPQTHVQ